MNSDRDIMNIDWSRIAYYDAERPENEVPLHFPPYGQTKYRTPLNRLRCLPQNLTEAANFEFNEKLLQSRDNDLTTGSTGVAIGQRIKVYGVVKDEYGSPMHGALVEIWQANSAGRYQHRVDQFNAPLDPNFRGAGRTLTDSRGGYEFLTIMPGPYPVEGGEFWRPRHIHFSVNTGALAQRLVTQMYFPGDPLMDQDPIFCAVPNGSRGRLISRLDSQASIPGFALAFRFDLIVRGARFYP